MTGSTAVEAEDELVEVGLQVLVAQAVVDTERLGLEAGEDAVRPRQGAHAVVILDQAGWHGSKRLQVPDNITLLPLPPRSAELNLVENVWQFKSPASEVILLPLNFSFRRWSKSTRK